MIAVGTYGNVDRIIAMKDVAWPLSRTCPWLENWVQIPMSDVSNPFEDATWKKNFPMRLSVIGKQKVGVAMDPATFRHIMEELGIKTKVPYVLEKKQAEEFVAKRKPSLPNHPGSWAKENALSLANSDSRAQEATAYPRP